LAKNDISVGVNFMHDPKQVEKAKICADRLLELRDMMPFFFSATVCYDADGNLGVGFTPEYSSFAKKIKSDFTNIHTPSTFGSNPFFTRIQSDITIYRNNMRITLPRRLSLELLNGNKTVSYTNFYCCQGQNVFFICEDGTVKGGVCSISESIGNIFIDDQIYIAGCMKIIKCTMPGCNSIENIPLPKFKFLPDAKEYINFSRKRSLDYIPQSRSFVTKAR
jgi:hypothetical protein